jgi:outer membrane protein OmpA-like peptidoglycan-associated protein
VNRKQRRSQARSKSNSRRAGVTYLAVAGLASGSLGFATPALATVTPCDNLTMQLETAAISGGNVDANFSGTCDFAEGFIFNSASTITGPADGSLTLRFMDGVEAGFTVTDVDLTVRNLNFARGSNQPIFSGFISSLSLSEGSIPSLTVVNSTFSDAYLGTAIYSEGNLTVSNSTFENLTSTILYDPEGNTMPGGAAIFAHNYASETQIINSTFTNNHAVLASGGAVNARGQLSITNSTFESNGSAILGGAVYSANMATIDNSTFVGNGATTGAAVVFGEGGLISNSTFWNNGDVNTFSIVTESSETSFFGNILANDTPNVVKFIDPTGDTIDLGANLYTDNSFADLTTGEGSSRLVSVDDLKLSPLALNTTGLINTGKTKTVSIGASSVARDFYSTSSAGIDPTGTDSFPTRIAALDQRGVARPTGSKLDVGAYEYGENPVVVPVETPVVVVQAPAAITKAPIAAQSIKFASGSSKLSSASKKTLRSLATEIQAKSLKTVNLEGYTATLTQAAPSGKVFRVKLSKARTAAVEKYLKEQFKKANYSVSFTKSSKGAANRVKSNKTEKGRIDNRRVEIAIN